MWVKSCQILVVSKPLTYFNQISSTQTSINPSSIHDFSCVLTINSSGIRSFLIVFSVFPLKINIGGSMVPLVVAESTTVTCFFCSQMSVRCIPLTQFCKYSLWVSCRKKQTFHPYFQQVNEGICLSACSILRLRKTLLSTLPAVSVAFDLLKFSWVVIIDASRKTFQPSHGLRWMYGCEGLLHALKAYLKMRKVGGDGSANLKRKIFNNWES